jgi:hypothetical protein
MVRLLIVGLFFMLGCQAAAQAQDSAGVAQDEVQFPETWFGDWSGELLVERGQQTLMSTQIRLSIQPAEEGCFTWHLSYGEASTDHRPYTLCPADSQRVHWTIDEHNCIVLDAYLHGDCLYSQFAVAGNLLLARDQLLGDTLYHEIISGPQEPVAMTGDTVLVVTEAGDMRRDTIPEVASYGIRSRQWTVMVRE